MQTTVPVVLASQSPRRSELLRSIGLPFVAESSDVDEDAFDGDAPDALVERLAMKKADAVARRHSGALVIGADTVVELDGEILGKPADGEEASDMLARLSGRTNTVYSGIALVHRSSARSSAAHEATRVKFANLTPDEIARYVDSGAPLDKAGAYGIQGDMGALFISGIQGDYFTVVGLPLHRMYRLMREQFSDLVVL